MLRWGLRSEDQALTLIHTYKKLKATTCVFLVSCDENQQINEIKQTRRHGPTHSPHPSPVRSSADDQCARPLLSFQNRLAGLPWGVVCTLRAYGTRLNVQSFQSPLCLVLASNERRVPLARNTARNFVCCVVYSEQMVKAQYVCIISPPLFPSFAHSLPPSQPTLSTRQ